MVFVNDLAGVSNVPTWMKHVPSGINGMTFVDVVFPAFLFIVGMAIPFAVENRLEKNPRPIAFWWHVLQRTFGLLVLGVFMVNSEEMNSEASLLSKSIWSTLFYVAAILVWNRYPKTEDQRKQQLFAALRILGIVVLLILPFLFRKGEAGALTGMTPSWWGILGLIGWAYLYSMVLFMAFRQKLIPMILAFFGLLILLLSIRGEAIIYPSWLAQQAGNISHSLLTCAGIVCALILKKDGFKMKFGLKIQRMLIAAIILMIIGYFVQPFGGINKNEASPTWALYSAAICFVVFPLVYWLTDIRGNKSWANFLKPAGQNPLLTYILPAIFFSIGAYYFIPALLSSGVLGFFRSLLFALFILLVAKWLTKRGIRMQL
jgi:hypothetical protein